MSTATNAPEAAKLDLAFRVGISGARQISLDALPQVRRQIADILQHVRQTLETLGGDESIEAVYRHEAGLPVRPKLRAVTPLADGADRIFAEIAEPMGYALDVPLPFDPDEYVQDFDVASRTDFRQALGTRPCLALDGGRGANEDASYEAVGRTVVRNCDLLVVVWDGHRAKGRGGTGDIVRFAARVGPPVWWIDAEGRMPPRLIRSSADLRQPGNVLQGDAAREALTLSIGRLAAPPPVPHHAHSGIIGGIANLFHRLFRGEAADPLHAYLAEAPRRDRRIWRTHERFLRLIGGRSEGTGQQDGEAAPLAPNDWTRHHDRADTASVAYSKRYRSSYVLVIALATLAVTFTVLGLSCHECHCPEGSAVARHATAHRMTACHLVEWLATIGEIVSLGLILWIVWLNQQRHWHDRWIAYRLLAELCRKQEALALLGWSLPASDLRRFGADAAPIPWVGWYFDALLRAAPLAAGRLSGERLADIRKVVLARLISGQADYHRRRWRTNQQAARALAYLGEGAFLLTCLVVVTKPYLIAADYKAALPWLAVTAALLPALSAAFVGIRGYAEVALLERQSRKLEVTMKEAEARVRGLDLTRPLASQDLAAEVYDLSAQMLQDVTGWADLFVIKAVEAS